MEDAAEMPEKAPSSPTGEVKVKKRRREQPPVYAPWSEGARKLDAEMQKQQETSDEKRLASIVSGLGSYDTEGDWIERVENFVKGPKCLEKLKELQRCLNREDPENRRVFLQLGRWNIVGRYIVPIILRHSEETHLFLTALKVAILLTVPVEANSSNTFDQVEYLCQFKKELSERNVVGAVVAHLEEPLANMERGSVNEDDWRLLQLVLALMQNLLAFPEPINWVGPYPVARYSQLRDDILACMFEESVPEVVLAIVNHLPAFQSGIRKDNLLLLQVWHHMFWGQKPEELCKAAQNKGTSRPTVTRGQSFQPTSTNLSRHSNFAGTFVRIDQDGGKTMLVNSSFHAKEEPRTCAGVEKSVARDVSAPLPSRHEVSLLLKNYADEILATGGYNILMQTVKDDIRRERKQVETSDITVFFRVAAFFTTYQHYQLAVQTGDKAVNTGLLCGYISSTLDDEMFKLVVQKWLEYVDSAKSTAGWIQVVSAGALLKDMIYILDAVLKCHSDFDRDFRLAQTLSYQLFYDQTESGILNTTTKCMKAFDIYKQPRSYLQTMVEITHVALKLIEDVIREDGALRVAKKARKRSKRRQTADTEKDSESVPLEAGQNEEEDRNKTENKQGEEIKTPLDPQEKDLSEGSDDDQNTMQESTLDIRKCVEKFADSTVVSNYCWLLTFYKSNSLALNHYIICMLHRICKDCDLEPMLYQLSILEQFHAIVSDSKTAKQEEYRSLVSFITKVTRNFFRKLKSCPLLYVDVLFHKSRKLCREITLDYTIMKLRGGKMKRFETRKAFLADALNEEDEDESLKKASPDATGLSRSVQTDTGGVALRSLPVKRRRKGPFTEQDETLIRELFEQFKEERRCSKLIAEALRPDGSISGAQVARKLKQLGLERNVKDKTKSDNDIGASFDTDEDDGNVDDEREDRDNDETSQLYSRNEDENKNDLPGGNELRESKIPTKRRRLVKHRDTLENREFENEAQEFTEIFNTVEENVDNADTLEQFQNVEVEAKGLATKKRKLVKKHRDMEDRTDEENKPREANDTNSKERNAFEDSDIATPELVTEESMDVIVETNTEPTETGDNGGTQPKRKAFAIDDDE